MNLEHTLDKRKICKNTKQWHSFIPPKIQIRQHFKHQKIAINISFNKMCKISTTTESSQNNKKTNGGNQNDYGLKNSIWYTDIRFNKIRVKITAR